jgi:short-subunit dehydrogenase
MVQMMASPYFGAFYVTRAFLPEMLRRRRGQIVNLTSPAGFVAWPGATAYTVARWAMRGFSEALGADLHGTGVRVTLVTPGLVRSPYFAHNPGGEERLPGVTKLFRSLSPEEVAEAIVRAVRREPREVTLPASIRVILRLHRVLPGAVRWALIRTSAWRAKGSP